MEGFVVDRAQVSASPERHWSSLLDRAWRNGLWFATVPGRCGLDGLLRQWLDVSLPALLAAPPGRDSWVPAANVPAGAEQTAAQLVSAMASGGPPVSSMAQGCAPGDPERRAVWIAEQRAMATALHACCRQLERDRGSVLLWLGAPESPEDPAEPQPGVWRDQVRQRTRRALALMGQVDRVD